MGFLVRAAVLVGAGALAYRVFAHRAQPAADDLPTAAPDDAPDTPSDVTNAFETPAPQT